MDIAYQTSKLQLSVVVSIICKHDERDNYFFIYFVIQWPLSSRTKNNLSSLTRDFNDENV